MDPQPQPLRRKNTLLDDRDAPFLETQQIAPHLAEVLMAENGTPIVLNREALEFAIETLQGLARSMESDPAVDMPTVYDPKTRRPWWKS